MASTYHYTLSDGIVIKITDTFIPPNEWEEVGSSGKLLAERGSLRLKVPPKICLNSGNSVITLLGASWDSEVGDTGEATVLGDRTPSKQTWELTSKD